jgi:hypothetical protein
MALMHYLRNVVCDFPYPEKMKAIIKMVLHHPENKKIGSPSEIQVVECYHRVNQQL